MNRRGFLRGAAAAVPAVAVAAPFAAFATTAENPELLRLAVEFDAAEAAFLAADEAKRAAVAAYEALAPAVPDDLVIGRNAGLVARCSEREVDVEGNTVWPDGGHSPRLIVTAIRLAEECGDTDGRTMVGRDLRRRLKIAMTYEADVASARERSGVAAAMERRYFAGADLDRLCDRLCACPATTLQGIKIKARAILAVEKIDAMKRTRCAFFRAMPLVEEMAALSACHSAC